MSAEQILARNFLPRPQVSTGTYFDRRSGIRSSQPETDDPHQRCGFRRVFSNWLQSSRARSRAHWV